MVTFWPALVAMLVVTTVDALPDVTVSS
jgi:hypothetical protein